jgi:alpha-L-arabinofuranosidase
MNYTEPEFQALAARMDKLETQNRRWKLASIVLALSSVSLVLIAAKPADRVDPAVIHARTVEAKDFVLKDEDGQIRARLTLNPNKKVEMNGRSVLIMNPAFGPALQFYDGKGDAIWTAPQEPTMIPAR